MLEAVRLYAGDDPAKVRFYQASSSEMFGKVQEVPQSETTLLWPRSPYGVAKVFGHYMTINYRESYGMHASLGHPVQPRVAAPRTGVRHPQGLAGGRPRSRSGLQDTITLGNLDAKRDWGFAGDYVEAHVADAAAGRGRRLRLATGETHSIRDLLDAAFAHVGIDDWAEHVEQDPRFMRPAEVDLLDRRREQGPRTARLEAHGRLPRAGRDDGRQRPRRAAGLGRPMSVALVTGVTGQDGSYLAERLLAEAVEVHGAGPQPTDTRRPAARRTSSCTRSTSATDPDALADLVARGRDRDEIYNLGGISSVARSWEEPDAHRPGQRPGRARPDGGRAPAPGAPTAARCACCRRPAPRSSASRRAPRRTRHTPIAPGQPVRRRQGVRPPRRPRLPVARAVHGERVILYNHESPRRPTRASSPARSPATVAQIAARPRPTG